MKIAFVSAASSSHTVKWVNALCKRGHKVRLYSLPEHENRQKNLNPEVEVVYLGKSGFAGYFLNGGELRRDLADFAPDIINAHYASGYGTLVRMARSHPLVLSVWGSDVYEFPLKSPVHKLLVAGNLKAADVVASTSEVMADQVRRVFGEQRKIWITPFGVDCLQFSPQPQEHDGFCVGAVKALEDVYGMDDLIRAFALFVQKASPGSYSLKIYGKGSRQEALQQLIDSLGLSECASLCGVIPNPQVPKVLSSMDAVCLPSRSESFGVSAVEAMACGVPVVASNVDGFLETVEDGVTGFLAPCGDVEALAEHLLRLCQDTALRSQMGEAGRERVLRLFDFKKNVEQMEQVYEAAIAEHKKGL